MAHFESQVKKIVKETSSFCRKAVAKSTGSRRTPVDQLAIFGLLDRK